MSKDAVLFLFIAILSVTYGENKYSRKANEKEKISVDFRTLEKPFRMNKLNMLWLKAQQRLSEPKLKSFYSDLMIQDKEEIIYKRMKSEGGDKEGMKEAELRKKLRNLMDLYGLREHFEDNVPGKPKDNPGFNSVLDDHINKSLFKDKKLNQLWAKAESAGFTSEELSALKEEFQHHQDKIDQYYDVLDDMENVKDDGYKNAINDEELEEFNEIEVKPETNEISQNYIEKANHVRDKHRKLRDSMDKLQRVIARGPNNKEFIEPKVQGLWKIATQSNFTADELASLKVELQHYEMKLLKLRRLHADHVSNLESHRSKIAATGDKLDDFEHQKDMIKKHTRKVDKMHADLESRIMAKHTEL